MFLFTDINECNFASLNVCVGNTRCQDTKESFDCVPCKPLECLKPDDDGSWLCATNPCQNGGTCQSDVADYRCLCAPGYAGRHCSDAAIHFSCSPNPCLNGGLCNNSLGGEARCWCMEPWIGRYCQVEYRRTCKTQPCFNNGTCHPDATHGYRCECPSLNRTLGPDCEMKTACADDPCQSRGTCVTVSSPPGYQCVCRPGSMGSNCEVDVFVSTTVSGLIFSVCIVSD